MTETATQELPVFALDPSQERAVDLVASARIGVVTGGPGTGKTTCLRTALDRIDASGGRPCTGCRGTGKALVDDGFGDAYEETCMQCFGTGRTSTYVLCAPTGKAARRMTEATGRVCTTVHRALDYGPTGFGEMGFRRNKLVPIDADLVVIDEASMLDVELAASLFDAINPANTRLVLVGDMNQLPSVGPGRVFADLIEAFPAENVARLTVLHRAAAQSWVCTQAPQILAGEMPNVEAKPDFLWVKISDRDSAASALVDVVTKFLPDKKKTSREDIQTLVPQRIGPAGGEVLNTRLQALLNPERGDNEEAIKSGPYRLRVGDRVIQTKNDYTLLVMNGEVGVIERAHNMWTTCAACEGEGRMQLADEDAMVTCSVCKGAKKFAPGVTVRFPDGAGERRVEYTKLQCEALQLAYALTIHKSQGSEWPWVVVFVHSTHTKMLTRNLLYTAITRAKVGVVIVGDEAGLKRAIKETSDTARNTALVERLRAS